MKHLTGGASPAKAGEEDVAPFGFHRWKQALLSSKEEEDSDAMEPKEEENKSPRSRLYNSLL